LKTPLGKKTPRVKRPQGVLDPRERQKQLKLPVQVRQYEFGYSVLEQLLKRYL
jgi:hypothetical protein